MGAFYSDEELQVRLYGADQYPADKRELRARTIAGLRIIQNSRQLDQRDMRADVFKFLLSSTALSYWKNQGWLTPKGRAETVRLTTDGLAECSGSLHGDVATNTSEEAIEIWEQKMLREDQSTRRESRTFQLPLSWT